jgi:hypothetical protein
MVMVNKCCDEVLHLVRSDFLTKNGDKLKKGNEKKVLSAYAVIINFFRGRVLITKARQHAERLRIEKEDIITTKVIKIQKWFLKVSPDSAYAFRIHRKNLYGNYLYCERRINFIRNSEDYSDKIKDQEYWLGRMEKINNFLDSLKSPEMVIINKEIENLNHNANYHRQEIKSKDEMISSLQQQIKEIKEKQNWHKERITNYSDKIEEKQKEKLTILDENYEKELSDAKAEYEKGFITWGITIGIPQESLVWDDIDGMHRDENLYLAYCNSKPFIAPEKPSEKLKKASRKKVIKKETTKSTEHADSTGDKKKPKKKKEEVILGDERCIGLKLVKEDGKCVAWCQCENRVIEGDTTCKRHQANLTGKGEGIVGKLGDKYQKDLDGKPSKWFITMTQTGDNADSNCKLCGL